MEKYLLECCIIYFWTVKGWVKTFAQVIYAVSLMGLIEVKQDLVLTDIYTVDSTKRLFYVKKIAFS